MSGSDDGASSPRNRLPDIGSPSRPARNDGATATATAAAAGAARTATSRLLLSVAAKSPTAATTPANILEKLRGGKTMSSVANFAMKLKRKAASARKRVRERRGVVPSAHVRRPVFPVKYTDRPERIWRRMPYEHLDAPSDEALSFARFFLRPQESAFPEFDGKVQLPPVTMNTGHVYITAEERSTPVPFRQPRDMDGPQSRMQGLLLCRDTNGGSSIFYPVHAFVDLNVPILFCFDLEGDVNVNKALHVRDLAQSTIQVQGWHKCPTQVPTRQLSVVAAVASDAAGPDGLDREAQNAGRKTAGGTVSDTCFCFELRPGGRTLGTGTQGLTFGCPGGQDAAFRWLNYLWRAARSGQRLEQERAEWLAQQALRPGPPCPPPPTRSGAGMWSAYGEVANTLLPGPAQDSCFTFSATAASPQAMSSPTRPVTVKSFLLSVGLILDERWAGGPAHVFTVEERAALHLQTWLRACHARYLVYGPHGLLRMQWAALVVQGCLRGWRIRRRMRRMKESARIIQRHWRAHRVARNVRLAQLDLERKTARARAYFIHACEIRCFTVWREAAATSMRAKDICRRALGGVVQHKFERWVNFLWFRRDVKDAKRKQERREKQRRAKFFLKKMLYRSAAKAIEAWHGFVERSKAAKAMMHRHLVGEQGAHLVAWRDLVVRMQKARALCSQVLLGVSRARLHAWRHYIVGRIASRRIQACWHRYRAYANVLVLRRWQAYARDCAFIIQQCWRGHVAWQTTWGAGGVFVRMCAARLIQQTFRGYSARWRYHIYMHKVRLLQGRFRYWLWRRESAACFLQCVWRKWWAWHLRATRASTMFQACVRGHIARIYDRYASEECAYAWSCQHGVVWRGVLRIPDRNGVGHATLVTATHISGTLRLAFCDPRTCAVAEIFLGAMQLVALGTERRGILCRPRQTASSLAEALLGEVIVFAPGQPFVQYMLRPTFNVAASSSVPGVVRKSVVAVGRGTPGYHPNQEDDSDAEAQSLERQAEAARQKAKRDREKIARALQGPTAYPLREPEANSRHNIVSVQVDFWEGVFSTLANRREMRLPLGERAARLALPRGQDEPEALRRMVLDINEYCNMDEDRVLAEEEVVLPSVGSEPASPRSAASEDGLCTDNDGGPPRTAKTVVSAESLRLEIGRRVMSGPMQNVLLVARTPREAQALDNVSEADSVGDQSEGGDEEVVGEGEGGGATEWESEEHGSEQGDKTGEDATAGGGDNDEEAGDAAEQRAGNNIGSPRFGHGNEQATEKLSPEVLAHATSLASLFTGVLSLAPIDLFDRIEHRAAQLLEAHARIAYKANAEWALAKGMRPPTRDALVTPSGDGGGGGSVDWTGAFANGDQGRSGLAAAPSSLSWEVEISATLGAMQSALTATASMEASFTDLREHYLSRVLIPFHESSHAAVDARVQSLEDTLFDGLQNAGPVQGSADMVLRAKLSTVIEESAKRRRATCAACPFIADLHHTAGVLQQLEEARAALQARAQALSEQCVLRLDALCSGPRLDLVAAFFSKRRSDVAWAEQSLLDEVMQLRLCEMTHLREATSSAMAAAEDMQAVCSLIPAALNRLGDCAGMAREDLEAWQQRESGDVLAEWTALQAEFEAKRQAKRQADLEAAARGGKTMEQVIQERAEQEAASRIQRVYRAYLAAANRVNAGGVWKELQYTSKVLCSAMDAIVLANETAEDDGYEAAMLKSLQGRVEKLASQCQMRQLGPSLKAAFVVEKRWELVAALVFRWNEEERLAALDIGGAGGGGGDSSSEYEDDSSDWDTDDLDNSDLDSDSEGEGEGESSDDESLDSDDLALMGNTVRGTRDKARAAAERAKGGATEIHNKLRVLWRAHLSRIQAERDRLAAIRAKRFVPRMKRKFKRGLSNVRRAVVQSPPARLAHRKFREKRARLREALLQVDWYQNTKLAVQGFGYAHFPQYFPIPEGVKHASATQIQRIVRGVQARAKVKRMAEERDEALFDGMLHAAAVKIQTLFRYYSARVRTVELVRVSYNKIFDEDAGKWCYHNTVADTYTYTKPPILGDALDLPTPRSKARGMKWSADYYVEKQKSTKVVQRKLVLSHTVLHHCAHPACNLMEQRPDTFVQCRRCKVTFYCGSAHQMNDIDRHTDECDVICDRNREARAKQRAADKMGVNVNDLMTEEEAMNREADKQAELRKLERLIDQLKKELITQEEYTFALRELKL